MMEKYKSIKPLKIKIKNLKEYIELLNGIFRLTNTEIITLEQFIILRLRYKQGLDNSIEEPNVFDMEHKSIVSDRLEREDPNTLNNYIKSLKDKGAIIPREDGGYNINKILIPSHKNEQIRITINPIEGEDVSSS